MIITAFCSLLLGFCLLAAGAELLVSGGSTLAKKFGVPTLLIGLTIIALGTSLPEIVTAIIAATYGNPNIAVGSSIGSNIANLTAVLGITAIFIPLTIHPKIYLQDLPILFIVMAFVGIFMSNGSFSRAEGIALLFGAFLYMLFLILHSRRKRKEEKILTAEYKEEIDVGMSTAKASSILIVGLILLPVSAELVIQSSIFIARYFNISDLVIGLTVVAFGTSLPELATSISAARKNEYDIVIGNIIGSNTLNLLVVLALAATIHPITIHAHAFKRDFFWMFGLTAVFYALTFGIKGTKKITRLKGFLLIALYICYLITLYFTQT